jgi:hypothetical protein
LQVLGGANFVELGVFDLVELQRHADLGQVLLPDQTPQLHLRPGRCDHQRDVHGLHTRIIQQLARLRQVKRMRHHQVLAVAK